MTSEIPPQEAEPGQDPGWPDEDTPFDPHHPALDASIANQARIYDYWLGGKDNFEADRIAGDEMTKANPDTVHSARANRAFLGRAVRYLAGEAGIRQFLDIGTGIPTANNTHQVAQQIAPESKIVYVDNDPVVLAYAEALLTSDPAGSTNYVDADVRNTAAVLKKAAHTLDFADPIAVTMLLVLHAIADDDSAYRIVTRIMDAVPPGSYLVISHPSSDIEPEKMTEVNNRANQHSGRQFAFRSHPQIMRFFDGLQMVDPGLVQVHQWRPDTETAGKTIIWGGMGRKL